jgi:excisionase family DNA binding protein
MKRTTEAEGERLGISVPEAGKRLGLGRNASYDAAHRGELPVVKFGRKMVVPLVALQRKLESAGGATQPAPLVRATQSAKSAVSSVDDATSTEPKTSRHAAARIASRK